MRRPPPPTCRRTPGARRALWLAPVLAAATSAGGAAIICEVPTDRPTIAAAVADPACATIVLPAGTFHESVRIERALELGGAGSDATTIEGRIEVSGPEAHVVIVSVGIQRVGFVVDQLIGQEEVVIKPLGKMLQGTPGMAGATITGDGRIALILDVPSMLKRYAR